MAKVYGRCPYGVESNTFVMVEWGPNYMYRIPPDDVGVGQRSARACLEAYYDHLLATARLEPLVQTDDFKPVCLSKTGEFEPATHMLILDSVDVRMPVGENFSHQDFKEKVLWPNIFKIIT